MPTVVPVLYRHRTNAAGEHPVYVRVSDAGKSRYVSLREYVRPALWNEKASEVRPAHPRADVINKLISDKVSEARDALYRMKADGLPATADNVKAELSPAGPADEVVLAPDLFSFADEVRRGFEVRGQIHTLKRYTAIFRKLRAYTGAPLPFDDVTPKLLRSFELHLRERYGNSAGTVVTNFNAVRAVYRQAAREGLVGPSANPFFLFSPQRAPRPERGKLTADELVAIEALGLPAGTPVWHARNYFLFSVYGAGVRFGDLARITWENVRDGRLRYTMSKTSAGKSLPLLPQAVAILERYAPTENRPDGAHVFPLIARYDTSTPKRMVAAVSVQNALVNRELKTLARLAEVQCHLTFHIARHTFADIARQRGWSIYDISKALGHSSLAITERYLKGFDAESLDARMTTLFPLPPAT